MNEAYQTFNDNHGNPIQLEPVSARAGAEHRRRRLSVVEDWLKRNIIDRRQYGAAKRLQQDWEDSCLTPQYATMTIGERVDGGSEPSEGWLIKKRKASVAYLAALAVIPARCKPVAEAVLTDTQSIREFAGSGGVQAAEARALALVALDGLVLHYDM